VEGGGVNKDGRPYAKVKTKNLPKIKAMSARLVATERGHGQEQDHSLRPY